MTVGDLVRGTDWRSIEEMFFRLYPEEKKHRRKLARAHGILVSLRPSRSRLRLCIEMCRDPFDHEVRANVFAKGGSLREGNAGQSLPSGPDDGGRFALDFVEWEEVLAMEVDPGTLERFTGPEIAAHVLYEVTWWACDPAELRMRAREVFHGPPIAVLPRRGAAESARPSEREKERPGAGGTGRKPKKD